MAKPCAAASITSKTASQAQVLSALATERTLVLGHVWITDDDGKKHHEIQAAQQLIETLGLSGRLFTLDALHAQKNHGVDRPG